MSTISPSAAKPTPVASHRVRGGNRTYFFDVKRGPKGGLYLSLSETHAKEGVFERQRLTIYEDHLREFYEGLCEAIRSVREAQRSVTEAAPAAASRRKRAA